MEDGGGATALALPLEHCKHIQKIEQVAKKTQSQNDLFLLARCALAAGAGAWAVPVAVPVALHRAPARARAVRACPLPPAPVRSKE